MNLNNNKFDSYPKRVNLVNNHISSEDKSAISVFGKYSYTSLLTSSTHYTDPLEYKNNRDNIILPFSPVLLTTLIPWNTRITGLTLHYPLAQFYFLH